MLLKNFLLAMILTGVASVSVGQYCSAELSQLGSPSILPEIATTCPPARDVAAFDHDLEFDFAGDPAPGTLVCRAEDGSANLTLLQARTYQALRAMKFATYDIPLPWTDKQLYDWFTDGKIRGIQFRIDPAPSNCCPGGFISVASGAVNSLVQTGLSDRNMWNTVEPFIALLIHEKRHADHFHHTCGNDKDQTIRELGAWGAQYHWREWEAFHLIDPFGWHGFIFNDVGYTRNLSEQPNAPFCDLNDADLQLTSTASVLDSATLRFAIDARNVGVKNFGCAGHDRWTSVCRFLFRPVYA